MQAMVIFQLAFAVTGVVAALLHYPEAFVQAQVIQAPDVDFGPGRISSRQARNHIGQHATVCGRVSNVSEAVTDQDQASSRSNYMNLGEPGVSGSYGADLQIIVSQAETQQHSPSSGAGRLGQYYGKIACVTGVIETRSYDRGQYSVPTIVAHSPRDITVLSSGPGTPPLQNQPSRCKPWERPAPDDRCVQYRAPY